MDPLNIIIAERSQLSRLGLITLIEKLGYTVNIKEITSFEKLESTPIKGHHSLLIVSASLLVSKPIALINGLFSRSIFPSKILILDNTPTASILTQFDDVIEFTDGEKNICRIIEKQIQVLLKKKVTDALPNGVSERERDVLRLVALGNTNKEIAEKLFISTHTVITHRKNITAKLGIKTIAGLTVYAVINKLISLDELK